MIRPGARWSSVRKACASSTGWRRNASVTAVPSRIRLVAPAAAAIATRGSKKMSGFG